MSSEEDASMALQVSNALTQALLQFRMNNLPKEVRKPHNMHLWQSVTQHEHIDLSVAMPHN